MSTPSFYNNFVLSGGKLAMYTDAPDYVRYLRPCSPVSVIHGLAPCTGVRRHTVCSLGTYMAGLGFSQRYIPKNLRLSGTAVVDDGLLGPSDKLACGSDEQQGRASTSARLKARSTGAFVSTPLLKQLPDGGRQ